MVRRSSRLKSTKTLEVVLQPQNTKRVTKSAKTRLVAAKSRAGISRSILESQPSSSPAQTSVAAAGGALQHENGSSNFLRRSARLKAAAQAEVQTAEGQQQKRPTGLKDQVSRPKKATTSRKAREPAARRATKVNNEQKIIPPAPAITTAKNRSIKEEAVRTRAIQFQNAIQPVIHGQLSGQAPAVVGRNLRRRNPSKSADADTVASAPDKLEGREAPGKCVSESQSTAPDTEMAVEGSSDSRPNEPAGLLTNGNAVEQTQRSPESAAGNARSSLRNVGNPADTTQNTPDRSAPFAFTGSTAQETKLAAEFF